VEFSSREAAGKRDNSAIHNKKREGEAVSKGGGERGLLVGGPMPHLWGGKRESKGGGEAKTRE